MRLKFKPTTMSIRTKIVLLFGSSMVLLFALFTVAMYFRISSTVVPLTAEYSQEIVTMKAEQLGRIVSEQADTVKAEAEGFLNGMMVDLSTMGEDARELYVDLLEETLERRARNLNPEWTSILFADTLGTGYSTAGTKQDVSSELYYQAIMANDAETFIGSPSISPETGEPVFIVAHKVMNSNSEKVGILAASVKLSVLGEIAEATQINSQGYGWIIDNNGLVLTHPDASLPLNFNLLQSSKMGYKGLVEAQRQMASLTPGFQRVTTPDGTKQALIFAPIPGTPGWTFAVTLPLSLLTSRINAVVSFVLLAGVSFIVAALAIAYYLSGTVSRPIEVIAAHLDQVAKGDLTQRLHWNRKDEVGRIASSFNQMSDNLKKMLQQIENITQQLSSASQELSAISEENSASIEEVAAAINQFATTVESVSGNAQEMVKEATSVQDLSERGREQMQLSSQSMKSIANSSAESRTVMNNVRQAAEQISRIVMLISDIAEQTNLLALNAAIEAARAGEHGRGFAVVADEVRNLSMETKKSVADINRIVEQLTTEVKHAAQVIEQNGNEVAKGNEMLQLTQANFMQIAEKIGATVRMINEVASAAKELEMGGREIAASSNQQSVSMEELARSAGALANMARELDALMTQFTIA